jgi:anti-sigma factor RsiW
MMRKTPKITESDIQAYVDCHLNDEEANAVVSYLHDHPDEAIRVEEYKKQNKLLNSLYSSNNNLTPKITWSKTPAKRIRTIAYFANAASIIWIAIGCVIGWMFHGITSTQNMTAYNFPERAAIAHAVYVPEVRHPVEVAAEQEAHLVKWLSKRLGKKLVTPDLNSIGFSLLGGRLLPSKTGPAAQFMYENESGERLTLYVLADHNEDRDTAFRFFEKNGINVFYWTDSQLEFAITGEIQKERLSSAADSVYKQLSY